MLTENGLKLFFFWLRLKWSRFWMITGLNLIPFVFKMWFKFLCIEAKGSKSRLNGLQLFKV